MLTLQCMTDVLEMPAIAEAEEVSKAGQTMPVEVVLSDEEIGRRVRSIRGSWSEAERAERREEAERRLESLLNRLLADHAA